MPSIDKNFPANPSLNGSVKGSTAVAGLILTIKMNDLVLCKSIVDSGTAIPQHTAVCNDCSPVLVALYYVRLEVALYLVDEGASTIGKPCSFWKCRGCSAVHYASIKASTNDLLRTFLQKDLEAGSPSFRSPVNPFHVAVANNNTTGLKILLEHADTHSWIRNTGLADRTITPGIGHNPETHPHKYNNSWATSVSTKDYFCNVTIPDIRLKWGWKVGSFTSNQLCGYSPMHIAVLNNSLGSASLLLEYEASVDGVNVYLDTPSHIAARWGYSQLLNQLIQSGLNISLRSLGETTAMVALSAGLSVSAINHGDSKYWSNRGQDGSSILHLAAKNSSKSLSLMLRTWLRFISNRQ